MAMLMLPTWLDQGLRMGRSCYPETVLIDPDTHDRLVREQYSRTPILKNSN